MNETSRNTEFEVVPILEAMDSWKALYEPIEKATGWKCQGFDPTLSFVKLTPCSYDPTRTTYSGSVQMPVDFAKELRRIIESKSSQGVARS